MAPKGKGSQKSTTPGGNPTSAARKRSSATGDGRYPIETHKQAESANKLMGRESIPTQKKIANYTARKFPDVAKKMRQHIQQQQKK